MSVSLQLGAMLARAVREARVLEIDTVQDLPRTAQDLIVVGLWMLALVGSAWALWYTHRERRI